MQALYGLLMEQQAALSVAEEDFKNLLQDMAFKQSKTNAWRDDMLGQARQAFQMMENQPPADRSADFFSEEMKPLARQALASSLKRFQTDKGRILAELNSVLDAVYMAYLQMLTLVPELQHQLLREEEERSQRHIKPEPRTAIEMRLATNPYLLQIAQSEGLAAQAKRNGIDWEKHQPLARSIYRQDLKENPHYQKFLQDPELTQEREQALARWLLKTFIFSSQHLKDHLDAEDSRSYETEQAVRHLMQETLKVWQENDHQNFAPLVQDEEWTDAAEFINNLVKFTLQDWQPVQEELQKVVQNWDLSRIAIIDLISIHMALTEFAHFPSVPVKVTMNEYLEMVKTYSTPQSQKFVNGVLDTLLAHYKETGRLRKSALGMLGG